MRLLNRFLTIHLLLLLGAAVADAASLTPGLSPLVTDEVLSRGQFRFGLMGHYLKTSANFAGDGAKLPLENGASVKRGGGTAFFQAGATDQVTVFTDLAWVTTAVTATSPTQTTLQNQGYGLGDADIGVRLLGIEQPLRLYAEAALQVPFYSRVAPETWSRFNQDSDTPLGTGVTEYRLVGTAEIPLVTDAWFGLSLGYASRSSGFSSSLPYRAYLRYSEFKGPFFRVGIDGLTAAGDDQFASEPTIADRSTVVLGGSKLYNAIDPSFLNGTFTAGTYFGKKVYTAVGVQYPLAAKNHPDGPLFLVTLGLDIGGRPSGSGYEHSNRGFQQYYLTSRVIQVNNNLRQVLIDKGINDYVQKGELLDIFEPPVAVDAPAGRAVARAKVIEAGPTRSKLQVLEIFEDVRLEEGFVVRRPVH